MRRRVLVTLAAALTGALGACAPDMTRPYTPQGVSNIRIEGGGQFDSLMRSAAVHVYRVDDTCRITYAGTIPLDQDDIRTGIPVGGLSYLVFSFHDTPLPERMTGARQVHEALIEARWGREYVVRIITDGSRHGALVRERRPGRTGGTDIPPRGLGECRPPRGFFRR